MAMERREYRVTFLTPAFLGDAEQKGRWRTPPFKALLRQWWRVAYAADHGFAVVLARMRHEEGVLFGHAWLDDDRNERGQRVAARRSAIRLRLDSWAEGEMRRWQPLPPVSHPEVGRPVGADLYLAYGPVTLPRQAPQPQLKANAAIQAGEAATLSVAVPEEHAARLDRALWLMDRYGTLGGRSRNGWGSIWLEASADARAEATTGGVPLRPWGDCLGLDWPHTLGRDDRGALIWETQPLDDWQAVMRELAVIKIGFRTQFVFPAGGPSHPQPVDRHWLAYPITRHTTHAWRNAFRLPNSLRFKVRRDENGKLRGVIFHVPCAPPPQFNPDRRALDAVWRRVHGLLDECGKDWSARGYATIEDTARRDQLKAQLNDITLHRIPE
jgi:CRISPR-associated protein Cmr1